MANIVYIATSIDGFIADKSGGIDWLTEIPNPNNDDFGFGEFMDSIDAVIMGRITYEKVLSFNSWPYNKPVFVLSNSLEFVPDNLKDKATILKGSAREITEELNSAGFSLLYIDGGKTIQNFLTDDLIDDLIITTIPVILGEGIPLFTEFNKQLKFQLVNSEVLISSLVKNHYKRVRE